MGPRGAGRHNNAVQPLALNNLPHDILGILGTGKEVFVHIGHPRKGLGIFRHLRHIDNSADIGTAITHKDPDARFFLGNIPLLGVAPLFYLGSPGR